MKSIAVFLSCGLILTAACSHTGTFAMRVPELIGSEWVLEDLGGDGVKDRVQSTLLFQNEGRIIGWGGCNRYFAGLRSDGSSIDIGPIGSTRKICPSVVMDQEVHFFQALEKARHISMQGDLLIIECEGFEKPLRFIRLPSPQN